MNHIMDETGSVLAEGIAVFTIITVISLCVFQCLKLSDDLRHRSSSLQKHMYQAKLQAEWEGEADETAEKRITFHLDGAPAASVKAMEFIYDEEESHFVILRLKKDEYNNKNNSP